MNRTARLCWQLRLRRGWLLPCTEDVSPWPLGPPPTPLTPQVQSLVTLLASSLSTVADTVQGACHGTAHARHDDARGPPRPGPTRLVAASACGCVCVLAAMIGEYLAVYFAADRHTQCDEQPGVPLLALWVTGDLSLL